MADTAKARTLDDVFKLLSKADTQLVVRDGHSGYLYATLNNRSESWYFAGAPELGKALNDFADWRAAPSVKDAAE